MNKNIFLAILLLFTITVFSQTGKQKKQIVAEYELKKLNKLENKFSNIYKKQKKEALVYAKKHNIETQIIDEKGNISTLQYINDFEIPVYYTTYNAGAAITTRTNTLYNGGSLNLQVEGQGMEIGVWDQGMVRGSHELLKGRVTQLDNAILQGVHATHVSGTLIGSETPVNGQARGMAFKANLLAYDYDNDLPEMSSEAANGMLISNHSYGVDLRRVQGWLLDLILGYYDDSAQAIDELAYNAPYYLMVFAAGNDRNDDYNVKDNGYDLLVGRALAKNNLTVAAVEQVNNYTSPTSVTMSSFSSWGPSDDGRIKPDISGKGVNVYSSIVSTDDASYAGLSGTSMASPNVAGSLLLLQQLNNNLSGEFLKSASIKALAIHTALEAGSADGPDYEYGWGLLNMEDAASVLLEDGTSKILKENTLQNQATYTRTVQANENEPLKVTIVWTDPEGTPIEGWDLTEDDDTPMLVNDLDLRVEDENGTVYYPWKLDPANPSNAATTGDNIVDNVEKIEIENPQGEYTISVTHKGTLQNLSQDFSIIISGVEEAAFTFAPDNIYKTICSNDVGEFSLNFLSQENYSETTTFSVSGLPGQVISNFSSTTISQDQVVNILLSNLNGLATNEYDFTVEATSSNGEVVSKNLTLNILNLSPLNNVSGLTPNDVNDSEVSPLLSWDNVAGSEYYLIEISKDPNFTTINYSAETQNNSIQVSELEPDTTYYWRGKAFNACYDSDYSFNDFHTMGLDCNTVTYSSDTPVAIDVESPNTQESKLLISESISIEDLNIYVKIDHTWLGDISLFLTSPSGTEVPLLLRPCAGGGENIDVIIDDASTKYQCSNVLPSLNGTIKPENSLFAFRGEDAAGEWTLKVTDYEQNDGGSIQEFGIEFCGYAAPTMSVNNLAVDTLKIFPNPTENAFSIYGLTETSSVSIFDLNGRKLTHVPSVTNNQQVDVSSLQSGVYFVRISSGANTFVTKKLIVN